MKYRVKYRVVYVDELDLDAENADEAMDRVEALEIKGVAAIVALHARKIDDNETALPETARSRA